MAPGMGSSVALLARGVLHIMTHIGRLRERGIVMGPVYKRVDILLAEVYERSGKRVISACKKAQKDKAHDHVVYLF